MVPSQCALWQVLDPVPLSPHRSALSTRLSCCASYQLLPTIIVARSNMPPKRTSSAVSKPSSKRVKQACQSAADIADKPEVQGIIETVDVDSLREILKYISNKDRLEFGLSCRRFNKLDMEFGGRSFKQIVVFPMELPTERTIATVERRGRKGTFLWVKEKEESEEDYKGRLEKAQQILKGAKTETLIVKIKNNSSYNIFGDYEPPRETLELIEQLKFKKLEFQSGHQNEFGPLMSRLFTILGQKNTGCESVALEWTLKLARDCDELNLDELRAALLLLPELKELEITFYYTKCVMTASWMNPFTRLIVVKPNFCLLDGPSLINIVKKIERATLSTANCAPEAILEAFEVVRDSPKPDKYAKFSIPVDYSGALSTAIARRGGKVVRGGVNGGMTKAHLVENGTRIDVGLSTSPALLISISKEKKTAKKRRV